MIRDEASKTFDRRVDPKVFIVPLGDIVHKNGISSVQFVNILISCRFIVYLLNWISEHNR